MQILDGKKIAQDILENLKIEVAKLPFQPVFCDVLAGDDPASAQYVKMKAMTAEKIGIKFRSANFPATITTEQLILEIKKIGQEENMCGLIVQLPLPQGLNQQAVLDAIDPKIDVDCTGSVNSNLFYSGQAYVEYPTATAVTAILDSAKLAQADKNFLVIGYGQLVGRPVEFLLKQRGLAVNLARSKTENVLELIKQADVIVSAAGQPKLITGEKIKQGAAIIDAGTAEGDIGGIVGDADQASVKDVAGYLSPVPGGVGPVTVAMLLSNVVKVAKIIK